MNAKDAIKMQMDMGLMVLKTYVSDLSDADLMLRPGKGCNHLAWQIGHLIISEEGLCKSVCGERPSVLPAGFAQQHAKDKAGSDDPAQFRTKQEYLDLLDKQRAATLEALANLPDADLDKPAPEHFRKKFPTVGAILGLIASHPLMHAGQFVSIRRQLDKPVLI